MHHLYNSLVFDDVPIGLSLANRLVDQLAFQAWHSENMNE